MLVRRPVKRWSNELRLPAVGGKDAYTHVTVPLAAVGRVADEVVRLRADHSNPTRLHGALIDVASHLAAARHGDERKRRIKDQRRLEGHLSFREPVSERRHHTPLDLAFTHYDILGSVLRRDRRMKGEQECVRVEAQTMSRLFESLSGLSRMLDEAVEPLRTLEAYTYGHQWPLDFAETFLGEVDATDTVTAVPGWRSASGVSGSTLVWQPVVVPHDRVADLYAAVDAATDLVFRGRSSRASADGGSRSLGLK